LRRHPASDVVTAAQSHPKSPYRPPGEVTRGLPSSILLSGSVSGPGGGSEEMHRLRRKQT
jgi:hypothetical protein